MHVYSLPCVKELVLCCLSTLYPQFGKVRVEVLPQVHVPVTLLYHMYSKIIELSTSLDKALDPWLIVHPGIVHTFVTRK